MSHSVTGTTSHTGYPYVMGVGADVVHSDWLALASMWEAPTLQYKYSNLLRIYLSANVRLFQTNEVHSYLARTEVEKLLG